MLKRLVPALLLCTTPGFASGASSGGEDARPTDPAPAEVSEKAPAAETRTDRKRRRTPRPRRCRAYADARYKQMVRNWYKVPRIPEPRHRAGYRDLTIYSVNLGERARVFPYLPDGTLDPEALADLERVFRDKDNGATHEIDPRLVKLLYKLAVHFDARQITLISGFRQPNEDKSEGAHGKGRAADITIPGVKLPALAKIARRLGHVGVGYYPTSGFVHLDVREGPSYFWADRSGPGIPGCPRQIMKSSGPRFDRGWQAGDDEPEQQRDKSGELLGAVEPSPDDGAEPVASAGGTRRPQAPADGAGPSPGDD